MKNGRALQCNPLFILSDLEMGGAQRVILTILPHLQEMGYNPHLALVKDDGPFAGEIPERIPVHRLGSGRTRYAFWKILQLCWAIRPPAVISTVAHLNLLVLMAKPFFPRCTSLFVREANTPSIRLQYTQRPRLYGLSLRALYPRCDGIVCNCDYMKGDLVDHFSVSPERVTVISNPVDVERICEKASAEPNPFKDDKIHIVSVGRFNYQKGYDLLLSAYRRCLENISDVSLTIVGDGPELASMKRLAVSYGISEKVSFVGNKRNPFPYMAHADFMVSSSRWEGSPNAVLESLACGTPVLAFDCPGGTAEVITDEENGWLVPAEDCEALANRMVEIVQGRKWANLRGKALLPEKYSCQNVVAQWDKLLKKSEFRNSKSEDLH